MDCTHTPCYTVPVCCPSALHDYERRSEKCKCHNPSFLSFKSGGGVMRPTIGQEPATRFTSENGGHSGYPPDPPPLGLGPRTIRAILRLATQDRRLPPKVLPIERPET